MYSEKTGSDRAMATVMAVNSFRSLAFMPIFSTPAMMSRYVTAPNTSDTKREKKPFFPNSTSPMITDARPMTMEPVPIWMSAKLWYCAMSAPESAMRALPSISPIVFMASVLMPCARDMRALMPVARMAHPISVPKNQYRMTITSRAAPPPNTIVAMFLVRPIFSSPE